MHEYVHYSYGSRGFFSSSFSFFFTKKPPVPASFLLICLYIRQPEDYMAASG